MFVRTLFTALRLGETKQSALPSFFIGKREYKEVEGFDTQTRVAMGAIVGNARVVLSSDQSGHKSYGNTEVPAGSFGIQIWLL